MSKRIAIPNEWINDDRLDFTELGALVYLSTLSPLPSAEQYVGVLQEQCWNLTQWKAAEVVARLRELGYLDGGAE